MQELHLLENKPEIKKLLEEIKRKCAELLGTRMKQIILFGSYARGEESIGSDVDIMLLIDEDPETMKKYSEDILDIMTDLSIKYDVVLSIFELSVQEYNKYKEFVPFYETVSKEGVAIYG